MKSPLVGAALVAALGLTAACSSPSPVAQPTQVARTGPAPRRPQPVASTGRSAIAQHDTPYTQVLAQARSSGRPTVLYFWTSW